MQGRAFFLSAIFIAIAGAGRSGPGGLAKSCFLDESPNVLALADALDRARSALEHGGAAAGAAAVQSVVDDQNGWKKVVATTDGVRVWRCKGSHRAVVLARATLQASAASVFSALHEDDAVVLREINPLVADSCHIEQLSPDSKITWTATVAVFPCRARDFVTRVTYRRLQAGTAVSDISAGIDEIGGGGSGGGDAYGTGWGAAAGDYLVFNCPARHRLKPAGVDRRFVRGEIIAGLHCVRPARKNDPDGASEYVMLQCFNAGPSIVPAWLMDRLAVRKPAAFVRRLEVVARRRDAAAAANAAAAASPKALLRAVRCALFPTGGDNVKSPMRKSDMAKLDAADHATTSGGGAGKSGSRTVVEKQMKLRSAAALAAAKQRPRPAPTTPPATAATREPQKVVPPAASILPRTPLPASLFEAVEEGARVLLAKLRELSEAATGGDGGGGDGTA